MKRLGCVIGVKENGEKEKQPVDDNVAVKRGADSRIICNLIFDSVDDAKLQNLLYTESFSRLQMMTLCSLLCFPSFSGARCEVISWIRQM